MARLLSLMVGVEAVVKDNATCPGIAHECTVVGADGLSCCGAEHGAGLAFCQPTPVYVCCSGDNYAISCPASVGCTVSEYGIPSCEPNKTVVEEVKDNATCPGFGAECKTLGADGLGCCGAEHGPGLAFCQTNPDYLCCSGDSWAISCPSAQGCSINEQGIPLCQKNETVLVEVKDNSTCPGVGQECKTLGADGLACCGAEHGAGFAFCQTDPDYLCCSGDSFAISCPSSLGCMKNEYGIPLCQKDETALAEVKDNATCPGFGAECKTLGADGLGCCGAEHGPGLAFCQTNPDYLCCSGDSWAISCPSAQGCSINEQGIPLCQKNETVLVEVKDNSTCPGVGQECKTLGADGLACCGAEHGPGFAFCQTDPDYLCCSGDSFAITCPSSSGCSKNEYGIPLCQKEAMVV